MASGGLGSWMAARRVVEEHGTKDVVLLFADVLIEARDLYDFLDDVATDIGIPITRIADGRTIWNVFLDSRFLGNTRIDPCSFHLKRKLMREWITEHCDPAATICYLGIDWSEEHRMSNAAEYWSPWTVTAPSCAAPYIDKDQMATAAIAAGLRLPSLYTDGFPHNNCGGGCVKAGQGQFKMLLEKRPTTYKIWEHNELVVRQHLGKDVAILRDRRGGSTSPLTLREFRLRLQGGQFTPDDLEFGGCACGTGDEGADSSVIALTIRMPVVCAVSGQVECDCADRLVC